MSIIKSEDIEAIVDFLYNEEANIYQEQIESDELKLVAYPTSATYMV